MYKTKMVTSFMMRPPSDRQTSVASTKSSTLQPAAAAALHQLVLSVESSREGLRCSCVHIASTTGDKKKKKTDTLIDTVLISLLKRDNKKIKIQLIFTTTTTHPAIPPRAMWLWPGMAPSLPGTKKQNIRRRDHGSYSSILPLSRITTIVSGHVAPFCLQPTTVRLCHSYPQSEGKPTVL